MTFLYPLRRTNSASQLFSLFSLFALLLVGCATNPNESATATARALAVASPTRAAPTATAIPSSTLTPTPTRFVTPTATLPVPASTPAADAIKLDFWHSFVTFRGVALQKLADKFNAANPKIYVAPSFRGTDANLYSATTTAIANNTPPDLVVGNPGDLSDYYNKGFVIALDDYIKDAKDGLTFAQLAEIDQNIYFDKFDNKTIGISFGRLALVMYYNAEMLKAAGFDKAPETWDEFDKVCAAVTRGDTYCYAFVPSASTFASWVWSRGGTYASSDEKKATFDEQAGVDTVKWLKNQADKKYAYQPTALFGEQTDFANGRVAFTFSSSANVSFYNDAVGTKFKWSVAPMPGITREKRNVTIFGPGIAILKSTPEEQRAAWVWLKFLLSKDAQVEWSNATNYFPAPRSALDALTLPDPLRTPTPTPFFSSLPNPQDQFKLVASFLSLGKREPIAPAWQNARGVIVNMLNAVFTQKGSADFKATDPTEAVKEGAERVNKILADYGK